MSGGPRRLVLRIYGVTAALVLAIFLAIGLVGWLLFAPSDPGAFPSRAGVLVEAIARRAPDRAEMEAEALRVGKELRAEVTVYEPGGRLWFSTATPPLPYPEGGCPDRPPDGPPGRPPEHPHHRPGPGGLDFFEGPRRGPGEHPRRPPVLALPLGAVGACAVVQLARPPPPPPLVWQAVVTVVVTLVGAGLAAVLLARSLSSPLATLAQTAQALGQGDLTARARLSRRDELGQVGLAFDEMADRLTLLLRSQQELMANVSHELRTPLARIRVALDLAAEGDAATAQELLREIDEDLGELQRLVTDVLAMARLDLSAGRLGSAVPPLRTERLEPEGLIDRAVQRFFGAHPGRRLDVSVLRPLPPVSADPVLLRRALDNLLDNAAQYSEAEAPVLLRAQGEGGELVLEVVDRGIGIASEQLASVGTPFFRTDKSRARRTGGLGLGLSLAKGIAVAHRGRLELQSALGVGTTATLRIPVAEDSPPASSAA